jgi:hypothetical protein
LAASRTPRPDKLPASRTPRLDNYRLRRNVSIDDMLNIQSTLMSAGTALKTALPQAANRRGDTLTRSSPVTVHHRP